MFEFEAAAGWSVQEGLFHVTDVVITARLIAGGSYDFLRAGRKRANQTGPGASG